MSSHLDRLEGLSMAEAEDLPDSPKEARKQELLDAVREGETFTSAEASERVGVVVRVVRDYLHELNDEHDDLSFDRVPTYVDDSRPKRLREGK